MAGSVCPRFLPQKNDSLTVQFFWPPVKADRRLLQAAAAATSKAAAPLEEMDVDKSSDAWPAAKEIQSDARRRRDGLVCKTTSGYQLLLAHDRLDDT